MLQREPFPCSTDYWLEMKTSDQIIEEWLVLNCQAGDRKAFELLVKRWNPSMLRRVYHTTKDLNASEDIVQEAWITVIKKIKTLRDPSAFQGWSLKIASYSAIDWIRASQRDRKREEIRHQVHEELTEKGQPSNEPQITALKQAISELPEEQRSIVQLFYQESLSLNTISTLLNIPVGTVKSRLFRGRAYLKEFLETKHYENEK